MEKIRLTQTVQKGGCAAKVAAAELRKILSQVEFPPQHKELIVDGRHFDDAAIYEVAPNLSMVQTIDFFTPVLDDPYNFGRVAACNAVSDVYAMGGRPVTAMAVLAFPLATLDSSIITAVLQGASDLLKDAGCTFVGGHSIDDDTLKFGLSVTGLVATNKVWTNAGAQAGDALILTKPLGTGTLTAALKRQLVNESDIGEAVKSMGQLNNILDYLNPNVVPAIHAATDITGFGLSGHSYQMAKASNKTFIIDTLPVFKKAPDFLRQEILTKAHRTNKEYTLAHIQIEEMEPWEQHLIHDPQTSGGLLLSASSHAAEQIVRELEPHFSEIQIIGKVVESQPFRVIFRKP